jgi:hypothetical protein
MDYDIFNSIVKSNGIQKYLKRWRPADKHFDIERSIKTYHPHSKVVISTIRECPTIQNADYAFE